MVQDIFSYNVEQSRGDTHNMIVILMHYHGLTLQEAIDYVGNLCEATINAFMENKERLPSWGAEIDQMVANYVQGLQDWIVGYVTSSFPSLYLCLTGFLSRSLHWSFQTRRYFGSEGTEIKKHRIVKLLPVRS